MSFDGIILLDKKPGITSMACDNFIKKIAGTRKVGHSGTLDPFATGLLPIFVGNALKLMRYTDDYTKSYRCIAVFGERTDTMDNEGTVIGGRMPSHDESEELRRTDYKVIRDAFAEVASRKEQLPPKYSAKKVDGRKAYELAREGKEVELKPHSVEIRSLVISRIWEDMGKILVEFDVTCSKGTYIRTICDDAGELTGFGAHAGELRRTGCGPFKVEDAYTEEQIKDMAAAEDYSFFVDRTNAVSGMPKIELSREDAGKVRQGKKIAALPGLEEDMRYAAFCDDTLIAILYPADDNGRKIMGIERVIDVNS